MEFLMFEEGINVFKGVWKAFVLNVNLIIATKTLTLFKGPR